jgi:uncharacterized protein (TIGR00375 family)
MSRLIADLHVHSGYSRATSKEMNVKAMALWGRRKGINLLGTGDFTHPAHFNNLKQDLIPAGNGLFTTAGEPDIHFMLTAEISSIYKQGGRMRKTHNLIFAPSFEIVEKINKVLDEKGNISSDGRPILGIPSKELIKIVLDISEECLFVPAHVWTPWFSLFGSKSGFDSIEECFEDYAKYIYAIETGLSSDPEMNWRVSALDNITLISNSDAHSPAKLGREANVLNCELSYSDVTVTIKKKDRERFLYTVEFFPEEGKYHFDGHRACGISFSPSVCNKPLVVGVTNRVDELADRHEGFVPENAIPSRHLVPLVEIIAGAVGQGVNTKKVKTEYDRLLRMHTEFEILLDLSNSDIDDITDERVAEGIKRVRAGDINVVPGYDGEYGKVSIF